MEFKAQIMVNTIETGGGAMTIIIDRTMTIAIVTETTTGGGTFRGITNAAESAKTRGNGPWKLADWHLLDMNKGEDPRALAFILWLLAKNSLRAARGVTFSLRQRKWERPLIFRKTSSRCQQSPVRGDLRIVENQ